MNRGDCIVLLSAAVAWALYLGGLDEAPGWDGFARGMAIGSATALTIYGIARFIQRTRRRPGQDRGPAPGVDGRRS